MSKIDLRSFPTIEWDDDEDRAAFTSDVLLWAEMAGVDLADERTAYAVLFGATLNNFFIVYRESTPSDLLSGAQMQNWCGIAAGVAKDIVDQVEAP